MICIDVGLYDLDCNLLDESYTAQLFRGVGDGAVTPDFMYVGDFVEPCMADPENPPMGAAFFYQAGVLDMGGVIIPICGT